MNIEKNTEFGVSILVFMSFIMLLGMVFSLLGWK